MTALFAIADRHLRTLAGSDVHGAQKVKPSNDIVYAPAALSISWLADHGILHAGRVRGNLALRLRILRDFGFAQRGCPRWWSSARIARIAPR